jgi:DNA-binding transcriptional ArsR family regulator
MVERQPTLLDATYGALAHDARRAIVLQLLDGEQRVTDVARPFEMSLAAVSKHVRVLEEAGLLHRRVEGRTHWLSLDPTPLVAARDWIDATRRFWEARIDALDAYLNAREPAHERD